MNPILVAGRLVGAGFLAWGGWNLGVVVESTAHIGSASSWGLGFLVVGATGGFLFSGWIGKGLMTSLRRRLERLSLMTMGLVVVGFGVGLVLASLLAVPLSQLPGWIGWMSPSIVALTLGGLGVAAFVHRQKDLETWLRSRAQQGLMVGSKIGRHTQVLLDTNVIIDGRIGHIGAAGFFTGSLIVPQFVVDELRHISRSRDALLRSRGRRGLEVMKGLLEDATLQVLVLDENVGNHRDVNVKMMRLARSRQTSILTTNHDFYPQAKHHGVRILSVNDLATALEPLVLPGDEIRVRLIQAGKEMGQGVGFLDDGTMVVVDGGEEHVNSYLDVLVARVIQTPTGRLIFSKRKSMAG